MLIHTVHCTSHLLLLQMSNELIALVFIVHIQPPKRIWMLLLKLCTLIVGFRTKLVYYIVPQGKCWWNMIPSSHSFWFEPPQDRPWFYNFTPWRTESMIIHYKMIHDPQKTIEIESSKPTYDSLKNLHADSVGRRFRPKTVQEMRSALLRSHWVWRPNGGDLMGISTAVHNSQRLQIRWESEKRLLLSSFLFTRWYWIILNINSMSSSFKLDFEGN